MKTFLTSLLTALLFAVVLVSCQEAEVAKPSSHTASVYPKAWETVLAGNEFSSKAAFESKWNYYYPWGRDHNGSARMFGYPDHVNFSGGVMTLTASRITWNEGNSTASPYLPIRYHSGAVHAKHQILINDQFPNYEVRGDFQAPSVRGTWPAFWLTGARSWPPESDILEFKGNADNWFNTFRAWNDVTSTIVRVSSPGSWHNYKVWITKISATDVMIHYYLDGAWKAQHRANFVGKPLWIIINLQMEGSSGQPGPNGITTYRARNVYVGRSRN